MIEALIPKGEFVGIEGVAHLCAGGESPLLKSHAKAIQTFALDKASGESARAREAEAVERARAGCAALMSAQPEDITFLGSASEGINNVALGLDWRAGDNVVIADVEFPSGILPWTRLKSQGVETRIVRHKNWRVDLDDIAAMIDARTRVVAISQVSMFTGQRVDVEALSSIVHESNAMLLLDATHALGVVPVFAPLADVVVSSCYKWLLGMHGLGVFYVNPQTMQDFSPPFLGWNSTLDHGGWENPTQFSLQETAHRFQPGNAAFAAIYVLNDALDRILAVGIDRIASHALDLCGELIEGIAPFGYELMTPTARAARAGNVCVLAEDMTAIMKELENRQVLIWGAYAGFGRLRVSTHLYNDSTDVARCIEALEAAKA